MTILRNVIADIESCLTTLGYHRSTRNFSFAAVPASTAHKSFVFSNLQISPKYLGANVADYGSGSTVELDLLWQVFGDHNATSDYGEGYLDAIDAVEEIENAVVKLQSNNQQENNLISSISLSPSAGDEMQEYLLISFRISLDVIRDM